MADTIRNYIRVTKPAILLGNLASAAGGFFLAAGGAVDMGVLLPTLTGIGLVVASGGALNNCADRHIDRLMVRTRGRVLAQGLISAKAATLFAVLLALAGLTLIRTVAGWLPAVILAAGLAVYAGLYSLYLKRHSVHGTLIGSLAGAAPPLAGYCAVSHRFDLGALILLAIFCLWQIPHSYAIAVYRHQDYAAAALPVLPGQRGTAAARKQIIGYILAFVLATPMLTFGGYTGYRYLVVGGAMSLVWLFLAWSGFRRADERRWARRLFVFSLLSIAVLIVMMAIDAHLPTGIVPICPPMTATRISFQPAF